MNETTMYFTTCWQEHLKWRNTCCIFGRLKTTTILTRCVTNLNSAKIVRLICKFVIMPVIFFLFLWYFDPVQALTALTVHLIGSDFHPRGLSSAAVIVGCFVKALSLLEVVYLCPVCYVVCVGFVQVT